MKILIIGIDGYLGWPLAMHLAARDHEVHGIDNFNRREWVKKVGSDSAIPIQDMVVRQRAFLETAGPAIFFDLMSVQDHHVLAPYLRDLQPDAIAHLGEMPSAPYSMADFEHAKETHDNNVIGSLSLLWAMQECPQAHLLKLGTMGEYGTPGLPIPEGRFTIEYEGETATVPFPRLPGSFYHATKVHDTTNLDLACRVWNYRATDIMQGVVYGTRTPEIELAPTLATRFDFDGVFGTAINRFCAQAVVGLPLTPYGKGLQKRGFLPLRDSIQCMTLLLERPPEPGECRVVNQLESIYGIMALAELVAEVGKETLGRPVKIEPIDNPRVEAEDHFYRVHTDTLRSLGYKPTQDMEMEIACVLEDLEAHKDRILALRSAIMPQVQWRP